MRSLGEAAKEMMAVAEAAAAAREQRLRARYRRLDECVVELPGISKILPADLSFDQFLYGTSDASVEAAEERLALCARCTGRPARCAGRTEQLLEIGLRPIWHEDRLTAEPCALFAEHRIVAKLRAAGVPRDLSSRTLDGYEPRNDLQNRALASCRRFVDRYAESERRGILIMGDHYGVGKTHLAIGILRALVERRLARQPMFAFVPEFLDRVRQSYSAPADSPSAQTIERARLADVLVLDDLGSERTTDWVQEQLTIILNARWAEGRALIVTSNALLKGIQDAIGPRAMSRLRGSVGEMLVLRGEDRRRNG